METTNMLMALKIESLSPMLVRRYMATTGSTKSTKIISVMRMPMSFSMRVEEQYCMWLLHVLARSLGVQKIFCEGG